MAKRKNNEAFEAQDSLESLHAYGAPEILETLDGPEAGQPRSNGNADERELAGLRKMLADKKAENDRVKQVQDIIFARGTDRDTKEEQIAALGYSATQVADIKTYVPFRVQP
jgi:hypothetical protein